MSVQDSIASQNLSEGNSRTALEMIKLQAQNMRATQAAGVAVRGQDIEQQQNFASNDLDQQRIDQAGEQNAFNRYAKERELGQADRGVDRADYEVYNQGDRKIANEEQQTANALELGRGRLALDSRGQDVDLQKAYMQNEVAQRSIGIQEGELSLKAQQEQLKRQREATVADAFSRGGYRGGAQALAAQGNIEGAAALLKAEADTLKFNREDVAFNNNQKANTTIGLASSEKDPAQRSAILKQGLQEVGVPADVAEKYSDTEAMLYLKNLGLHAKEVTERTTNEIQTRIKSGEDPNSPEIKALAATLAPQNQVNINNVDPKAGTQGAISERIKGLYDSSTKAQQALNITQQMVQLGKNAAEGGIPSGPIGAMLVDTGIGNGLSQIGVPISESMTNIELMNSLNVKGSFANKPPGTGSLSDKDMDRIQRTMPSGATPQENLQGWNTFSKAQTEEAARTLQFNEAYLRAHPDNPSGVDLAYRHLQDRNPIVNDNGQVNPTPSLYRDFDKFVGMSAAEARSYKGDSNDAIERQQQQNYNGVAIPKEASGMTEEQLKAIAAQGQR